MNIAQTVSLNASSLNTAATISHTLAGRSLPSGFYVGTDHNE